MDSLIKKVLRFVCVLTLTLVATTLVLLSFPFRLLLIFSISTIEWLMSENYTWIQSFRDTSTKWGLFETPWNLQ
jgi:hypothetical protein